MKSILTSLFSLLLCATLHAQIPSYVPSDGLVGWWPFNGNANDESGNGNHGVVNGAFETQNRFGSASSALYFPGNGSYVEINDNMVVDQNSDYTWSFWANVPNSNFNGTSPYNATGAFITCGSWWFTLGHSGVPGLFYKDEIGNSSNNWYVQQYYNIFPEINTWKHYVIRKTGTTVQVYYEGQFINQLTSYGFCNFNNNYGPLMGIRYTEGNSYYIGSMDDFGFWNRALTPEEINQLYTGAEEPVATCTPLAPNLQNGLVGYWPFCGNANDESGNGNNGVVNGATLAEDRFGNANAAYSFNGGADEISALMTNYSEFTVSFWSYADNYIDNCTSNTTGNTLLSHKSPNANGNGFVIEMFNGTNASWIVSTNAGLGFQQFPQVLPLGQWYNIIMTTQPNGPSKLFLNGELIDENNLNLTIAGGQLYPFRIGAHTDGNTVCHFTGKIDDVAYWNRALTLEEITQLYAASAAPCNLIASETQDTPVEVGGSAQLYVTLNATDYSMQWQTNAAGLGWMDVQDNITYTGSQTQNLLISNATLANHEQPFRIIVTDGICNDTSDVALLLVNNTCTAFDTVTTTIEVFDTLTIENVVEVYDTLTIYNTIDIFDTTSVTVEVFDTITNVIDVFDTTTIYLQVDIYDTLFIDVYDTTYIQQTIDVYDTTYVTLTDTTYIQVIDTAYVTVTDTLLIDITFVGFEGQPSWLNTVLVYPNPASDHITIDYGNFALMAGYNTVITDAAGATVYSGAVNSQQAYIDINAWGAAGVYYLSVYDVNGAVVAVRQIVLE